MKTLSFCWRSSFILDMDSPLIKLVSQECFNFSRASAYFRQIFLWINRIIFSRQKRRLSCSLNAISPVLVSSFFLQLKVLCEFPVMGCECFLAHWVGHSETLVAPAFLSECPQYSFCHIEYLLLNVNQMRHIPLHGKSACFTSKHCPNECSKQHISLKK